MGPGPGPIWPIGLGSGTHLAHWAWVLGPFNLLGSGPEPFLAHWARGLGLGPVAPGPIWPGSWTHLGPGF